MGKSVITCQGMAVGYGSEEILTHVDFSVSPGELLPVIGPNGSGKTTFLKALLGLIPLRRGSLTIGSPGQPPAYVPQQKQIDPLFPVSVHTIVSMGLYPEIGRWRRPNPEQRRRLSQALAKFGLSDHRKKAFGELSGGMRQKCLLARAFVTGANLFILDEPTAGLDSASEEWLLKLILDLNQNEGITVLMAHHRLEDLSFLSPAACLVDQGQVLRIPAATARDRISVHAAKEEK